MNRSYLSQFDKVTEITKGMSGDKKYRVKKDGVAYLLRSSDATEYTRKKKEYDYLNHLNKAALPVPTCIAFEQSDEDAAIYTLLSWVEGEEAEKVLPKASAGEQYAYGVQAGSILRKIHENSPKVNSSKNWHDRYWEVIKPRLEAFLKEGISFAGDDKILGFIEENKYLLKTRSLCYHHGDYHMGNLIIDEGKLWVIDWHTVDFDNMGDPWYEFNRIGTEYPMFAKGQIDGYFENQVPEEFWKLFALYFSASAITSIVWAKYWAPDELDSIMALNKSVLNMFEGMENPIPGWYRE